MKDTTAFFSSPPPPFFLRNQPFMDYWVNIFNTSQTSKHSLSSKEVRQECHQQFHVALTLRTAQLLTQGKLEIIRSVICHIPFSTDFFAPLLHF